MILKFITVYHKYIWVVLFFFLDFHKIYPSSSFTGKMIILENFHAWTFFDVWRIYYLQFSLFFFFVGLFFTLLKFPFFFRLLFCGDEKLYNKEVQEFAILETAFIFRKHNEELRKPLKYLNFKHSLTKCMVFIWSVIIL